MNDTPKDVTDRVHMALSTKSNWAENLKKLINNGTIGVYSANAVTI